jgi:hypothetical protein
MLTNVFVFSHNMKGGKLGGGSFPMHELFFGLGIKYLDFDFFGDPTIQLHYCLNDKLGYQFP